ncbi:MAG: hypothetical protein M1840_003833 [Geoglossum simile]|nr:MAG: hypothetical protein M1840_003833 [Geoglossum simile]
MEVGFKDYRKVYVKIIHWEIDGLDKEVRNLERVFRDVYGYNTELMTLFTPGEGRGTYKDRKLQPGTYKQGDYMHAHDTWTYNEGFLDEMFPPEGPSDEDIMYDVLQITCYLGATVCEVGGKRMNGWWYLSAIPCSPFTVRDKYIASGDANWLGLVISMPELYADTLFIMDCNLEADSRPMPMIRSQYDQCFEAIAVKYRDQDRRPGSLLQNLATILENTVTSEETLRRKGPFSTIDLGKELSKAMRSEGSIISTPGFREQCPYMITLERTTSPIFRIGEYHQLSDYNSRRVYKEEEKLYENGMVQVIKASMLPGTHKFRRSEAEFTCAIKRFKPRARNQGVGIERSFEEEVEMLKHVSSWKHENILGFLGAFKVPSDGPFGTYAIILPYADGGSLYDFLRLSEEPRWLRAARKHQKVHSWDITCTQVLGIIDALSLLHTKMAGSKFMIHRDIKPANILIRKGVFKIADFGLARFKEAEETSKTGWDLGTPMYEPPERSFHQEFTFGRARDIWALGCVILETLVLFCFGFSKTPKLEEFELDRFKASGDLESRKFSVTQECVGEWMDQLEQKAKEFQPRSTGIKLESLLENARNMLKPEPLDRITAAAAKEKLHILKGNSLPLTSTRVEKRKALPTHLTPKTSGDTPEASRPAKRRPRPSTFNQNLFTPLGSYFSFSESGELQEKPTEWGEDQALFPRSE